jgi:hypothetical protein
VQVRAGIDFEIPERRGSFIDALAVGELASVGDALVVGHRELGNVEQRRQREVSGDRCKRHDHEPERAAAVGERSEPQQAAEEPEDQRHHDEVVGGDRYIATRKASPHKPAPERSAK